MAWLSTNGYVAEVTAKWFVNSLGTGEGSAGWFLSQIAANIDKIIAGLVGSFGAYKWWVNREAILHKRLIEYLNNEDRRLHAGQAQLLNALQRPGPGQTLQSPLFAPLELRRVLKEKRWDFENWGLVTTRSSIADLGSAKNIIGRKISASENALRSHREQLGTAFLLHGAIAAAQASNSKNRKRERALNGQALNQFRSAMSVPDFSGKILAIELLAHQFRKIGDFQQAEQHYLDVERLAESLPNSRHRNLTLARCKRYRAEILLSRNLIAAAGRLEQSTGSHRANALLRLSHSNLNAGLCAFDLRDDFAPFHEWELIEQAELYYLSAVIAAGLSANDIRERQLADARSSYETLISELPAKPKNDKSFQRRLRRTAERGLQVVKNAEEGSFDIAWLMPEGTMASPSHNPQQPAHPVSSTGGDEGVQKTA